MIQPVISERCRSTIAWRTAQDQSAVAACFHSRPTASQECASQPFAGDEALQEAWRLTEYLQSSGHPALRNIRCLVTDHHIYLRGTVRDYVAKQRAQECIKQQTRGPRTVLNQIQVKREQRPTP